MTPKEIQEKMAQLREWSDGIDTYRTTSEYMGLGRQERKMIKQSQRLMHDLYNTLASYNYIKYP